MKKLCDRCGRAEHEGEGWEVRTYADGSWLSSRHTVCPEKVCKERKNVGVPRWPRYEACSRDAKSQTPEGEWLCGIHLGAYKRRKATDARYASERNVSDHNKRRAEIANEILSELGVNVQPDYSTLKSMYTGNVVIDPDDLLKLVGIGFSLPPKNRKEMLSERITGN